MNGKAYKCRNCGNVVELLVLGGGELSCCGTPLKPISQGGLEDIREMQEPPIDLMEVIIGGKSRWEFSSSREGRTVSERGRAWEGDSGGLGCF